MSRIARKTLPCAFAPRAGLHLGLAAAVLFLGCESLQNAAADGDTRTITMHHLHTKENITVTFKRNGRYDQTALKKLNWFLRDWRKDKETRMDPRLIDLMWEVYREVDATRPIQIICGYRDESTNSLLRRRSNGVAQNSLHMSGKAMDFAIPDVPLEKLRVAGLRLQRGGVGFYPSSGSPFVHMDIGGVRHWPRMTRGQLARVFPNGRTVHVPTDGQPLAGYALALTDIERRGASPSSTSVAAVRDTGISTGTSTPRRRSLLASIFGLTEEAEEAADTAATPAPVRVAVAAPATQAPRVPLPKGRPASAPVVVAVAVVAPGPAADAPKTAVASPQPQTKTMVVASAPLSPNEIIRARGYWVGVPDMNPPGPADPTVTGSIPRDWLPPTAKTASDQRLAYAAQPEHHAASGGASRRTVVMRSAATATSIAVKAGGNVAKPPVQTFDPWLNAVTITPSVWTYLSSTQYGERDFRSLQPLLDKPAATVVMAFSDDPHRGLSAERFSGHAVVFVGTITFAAQADGLTRTASLR
ncbi:MAG: DUF882 domain-containing protein [Rhizobiales bacterium]|nr:DUF882 domain-containing protein [Hyphomicrobiales bacterium]